ncbi:tRNA(m(1)G37)methyltransferase [Pseudogymnoascus destructans]|uniref:tRNA (guanine(37)-N1)-methyltransferase n=2 Tax=Pseudogymnoascus destructans TaxID=655981 RepID=L8GAW0_PSED2|nr:tRNA(m(1)G37)methyltransferase [Pseudogymnoascus destructans]ELR09146.1 hypothetical protein GMDG_03726 [Pseudogymnoascus destructans 20631-21]OAF59290.1 tRNA(m(1)G37)methyltransferase [Pseudogymnoascus destructans]
MSAESASANDMFRPPIVRSAAAVLDRSLFTRTFPIAAARITDHKLISPSRGKLEKSKELLRVDRVSAVREDPDPALAAKGGKCLLLRPEVKPEDPTTWSAILKQAVEAKEMSVMPYELTLDYNYWNYLDIMKSILPEDSQEEIPVGFSIVGHIAHLNIREAYLPFKNLIAEVLIDKNPTIRTVINKIDDVGDKSEFRTFSYELLAGVDDLNVKIREEDCTFRFDYSQVYWNSRLNTEHRRLVAIFDPGSVVCDVMAGVGPFALPAAKKGVFVWANDLNPASIAALRDATKLNKVAPYIRTFNTDGHKFIHQCAQDLLAVSKAGENKVSVPSKQPRMSRSQKVRPHPIPPTVVEIPQTISHFVMNLPATAITFLPAFRGLYAGHESLFAPHTATKLPMVHVHCFSTKSEDNVKEGIEISGIVSEMLGVKMEFEGAVEKVEGDPRKRKEAVGEVKEGRVRVHDVRDVAPLKRMFCASFRIPAEVAFAKV